ncbi:MAG: tagaturonate epimerase family protein [Flavobacteriaceae bacterium]
MKLEKYSFGTGDRFGNQGSPQLQAIRTAKEQGVDIAIVWNKSHREHLIVGTSQVDVRREADIAVKSSGWSGSYYVDADHIGLSNVDNFLDHSDFFTLDVADYIGEKADEKNLESFVDTCSIFSGRLHIEGIEEPLNVTREKIRESGEKYLFAIQKAAEIYNYIESVKGKDTFITEVSMDETEEPQTPEELLFILAALANQKIPAQTIAPKFTGRFNKGIDYQGDVDRFNREFSDDICVIRHAVSILGLPRNLKLSVHSGSDKFSIYPGIRKAIELHDAGVHVKTAGTTWLEELIGLAEAGESSSDLVKDIYSSSFNRFDELCGPYSSVIDIDRNLLPSPEEFRRWNDKKIARSIRHDKSCSDYDKNIRQLLHVGYKVAAEYGKTYLQALETHKDVIGKHVCSNLFEKHITPLFL